MARPKKSQEQLDKDAVIFAAICARISTGETLQAICKEADMPCAATVYDWIEARDEFSTSFAQARAKGHDAIAAQCIAIADEMPPTNENGGTDAGYVAWQKNRIWTRTQLLAKWDKRYSDRVQIDATVSTTVDIRDFTGRTSG